MVILLLLSLLMVMLGFSEAVAHDPSAYGGLFRSRDNGATWFPANTGFFLTDALGVAISPTDANHLLLATSTQLLRSRNGGRDWVQEAPTVLFGGVYAVAFDSDGQGSFVSTNVGIYLTEDGNQWHKTSTPKGATPAYVIAPGSVTGRVYVAGPGGLWRSEDRGRSWSEAGKGLPSGPVIGLLIPRTNSEPGVKNSEETLYVLAGGSIWMSPDGMHNWQPRDTGLPMGRVQALSQDPEESSRLWAAAADQVFTSNDGGESWHPVGRPLPEVNTSIHGIAAAEKGTVIVLTTHRGLFRSTDGGDSWLLMEGNLPIHLEAGPLVRDPHHPATLYAGYALTPYSELRRTAMEGGSLLSRADPVSLIGGAAFLILLTILGIFMVRWLARSRSAAYTTLSRP